jgi:glutaredoxin
MPIQTTVITPARFAQGLSYADFLAQAAVNRDKFEMNYKDAPLTGADLAFFKNAASVPNGAVKVLAIAEAWCGDVYRELPTIARIAEASGMTLRIFLRDQNPDIMDEFLSNGGQARAIPVFAFYTAELNYITHFTERSKSADLELAAMADEVKAELGLAPDASFATLPEPSRQAFLKKLIPRIQPHSNQWRKDAIQEIRQLLSSALMALPIVYTIRGCDACVKLLEKWKAQGVAYEERRVELNQETLDEARRYGMMVPIVVWPDGRVEQGLDGNLGCFI